MLSDDTIIVFAIVTMAVLLIFVLWVMFYVGRIVLWSIRDARAGRQPPRLLQHPEFGTLRLPAQSSLWEGVVRSDGRDVGFFIAGTESSPDGVLLERLRDCVDHLREREGVALAFVRAKQPDVRDGKFALESLEFLYEAEPDTFSMEFALEGDDDGFWRVTFEAGAPTCVGRDD